MIDREANRPCGVVSFLNIDPAMRHVELGGIWYVPHDQPRYNETGIASWYGDAFNMKATADGEIFGATIGVPGDGFVVWSEGTGAGGGSAPVAAATVVVEGNDPASVVAAYCVPHGQSRMAPMKSTTFPDFRPRQPDMCLAPFG